MIKLQGIAICEGIVIGRLCSLKKYDSAKTSEHPVILYANELSPTKIISLFENGISSFVLDLCTENSHSAILARNKALPCLYGIKLSCELSGKQAIIDGYSGTLIIEPTEKILEEYHKKLSELSKQLPTDTIEETFTKSGKRIRVFANINDPSELDSALKSGADGVFFKTEFMYMRSSEPPSENAQFEIYKSIAQKLNGKSAVIRTIDIGADKTPSYIKMKHEDNPQLGIRGIRLCLQRPELFIPQLKAIIRASAFGNISVMLPMVNTPEEVLEVKKLMSFCKNSLSKGNIAFSEHIPLGIMVETPCAVFMSDELAKCVDFFSIGTNDLTQYIMASDRLSPDMSHIYNPHHKAVQMAIQMTSQAALNAGIYTTISGELGGDISALPMLIENGVTLFAVAPSKIQKIKQAVCLL